MFGTAFAAEQKLTKKFRHLARTCSRAGLSERVMQSQVQFHWRSSTPENVEPNVGKCKTARSTFCPELFQAHDHSPEAPMAVKNMQTLVVCAANINGVRVTGTECNGSLQVDGKAPRHFLSLLWLPLPGHYPIRTGPDAKIAEDNPALARAERTGRSASGAGVSPSIGLARRASRTVLSTRSTSTHRSFARFANAPGLERKPWNELASQRRWLAMRPTNLVRG